MPYFILQANGVEIDRYELTGSMTLGRSAECTVPIHDILMSRMHARIEKVDKSNRWRIVDTRSKNGTHFNWRKVDEHVLFEGDSVRMGRTYLEYHSGPFIPSPTKARKTKTVRPADPHEALTGTVSDFVLVETDGSEEFDGAPSPSNRTGKTASVGSVLEELSSSWDTVATAVKPTPRIANMPRPMPVAPEKRVRRRPEPDMSLHATAQHLPYLEVVPQLQPVTRRNYIPYVIAALAIGMATLVVLFSGWIMMQG